MCCREYTDASFTTRKAVPDFLGTMGPMLVVEVRVYERVPCTRRACARTTTPGLAAAGPYHPAC
jgi:hypothetical protein